MTGEPGTAGASGDRPSPALWDRAKQAFGKATELSGDGLKSFLESLSAEDPALRRQVVALLEAHSQAKGLLDRAPGVDLPEEWHEEELAPGTMIGRYRVVRLLARGGMGAVYEAVQERPQRTVALKVVRQGLTSERGFKRFTLEAEMLGRLQHPGIAQIYEAGLWEGAPGDEIRPYFAMELVRGKSIAEHSAGLTLRERAALLAEICEAVAHAHQRGVVHRDLKPANILVDSSGGVKVLDFGVARSTDADLRSTIDTKEAQIVGTVPYMSPEQVSGESADIDVRSDVYTLGIVAYELLTGTLPYNLSGATIMKAAQIIREVEPSPPVKSNPALRGDLEVILLMALAKERERRYDSAGALGADLRRYLNDEPVVARPPSASYRARKFVRRHRALVTGTGAVVLALVAGMVTTTLQAQRARRSEARARESADELRTMARTLIGFNASLFRSLGTMEQRRDYIGTALHGLDLLARSAGDDPSLKLDLAGAYQQYGEVQGYPLMMNVGDSPGALVSFRKALAILEDLSSRSPRDIDLAWRTAGIRKRIGMTVSMTGRIDETVAEIGAAINAEKRVLELLPGALDAHSEAAYLYWRLVETLINAGRRSDAAARADEAWALSRQLAPSEAPSPNDLFGFGNAYASYSRPLSAAGSTDRALELLDQAGDHLRRAAQARPNDAGIVLTALDVDRFRADAYSGAGDDAREAESLERHCDSLRGFGKQFPERWDATDLFGTSLSRLGGVYERMHRAPEGIPFAEESVAVHTSLLEREPKSVPFLQKLMNSRNKAGQVLAAAARDDSAEIDIRRGRMVLALERYKAALDTARQLESRGSLAGQPEDPLKTIPERIAECQTWLAADGTKGGR